MRAPATDDGGASVDKARYFVTGTYWSKNPSESTCRRLDRTCH